MPFTIGVRIGTRPPCVSTERITSGTPWPRVSGTKRVISQVIGTTTMTGTKRIAQPPAASVMAGPRSPKKRSSKPSTSSFNAIELKPARIPTAIARAIGITPAAAIRPRGGLRRAAKRAFVVAKRDMQDRPRGCWWIPPNLDAAQSPFNSA